MLCPFPDPPPSDPVGTPLPPQARSSPTNVKYFLTAIPLLAKAVTEKNLSTEGAEMVVETPFENLET